MFFDLIPLRYEYLTIIISILIVSLIIDYKYKISINSTDLLQGVGVFFVVGVIWDWYAISRGHWIFLPENVSGIFFGIIPLEDILFILIIPYFVLIIFNLVKGKTEEKMLAPFRAYARR